MDIPNGGECVRCSTDLNPDDIESIEGGTCIPASACDLSNKNDGKDVSLAKNGTLRDPDRKSRMFAVLSYFQIHSFTVT